jgi:hypothetical protein
VAKKVAKKIEVEECEFAPICPHCNQEITKVYKRSHGIIETHTIYLCSICRKILSIGYNYWS